MSDPLFTEDVRQIICNIEVVMVDEETITNKYLIVCGTREYLAHRLINHTPQLTFVRLCKLMFLCK